jgi:DNA-binding NtrC family response regulator
MGAVMEHASMLASTDRTTVLILGEGGTGKGRIAEMIHAEGPRAAGHFVPVHCREGDAESLERELFGTNFDGPSGGAPGLVELAAGGTLFFDEVANLPLSVQPRILRLLEQGVYRRVSARGAGGGTELRSDVRIIAASSKDLVREVDAHRLREDLYYRLCVMPLRLPPLRERPAEDVVELVARLMEELEPQLNGAPKQLSEAALGRLLQHHWPGNIRELRNVLERAMILSGGKAVIDEEALPFDMGRAGTRHGDPRKGKAPDGFLPESLEAVERAHIERTLRAFDGNRTHTSRALGVSRATLIKKIQEYGLSSIAKR